MPEIGVAEDVLEREVLPLGRLLVGRGGRGDEELDLPPIAPGDTIFLWVERRAIVGTGCARGLAVDGGGDLSVDWDWSFGRRLPSRVEWVSQELDWDDRVRLFSRDGAAIPPFVADSGPLVIEISGKDVLALIRCGERY